MRIEDGPSVAVLAVAATRLIALTDAVPLPPPELMGWSSPTSRAYAQDVRALQRSLARLRDELAELAVLLARAGP